MEEAGAVFDEIIQGQLPTLSTIGAEVRLV